MKEIRAYRLTDGTIVEDKKIAIEKQEQLTFEKEITKFADAYGTYDGVMQIRNAIIENPMDLYNILHAYIGY